ncbi:MAG TPA: hypothetical protein VN605_02070 [Thermoanaerobaculia bacterium]|nr:hypothetical protein [Thermoanaerobaculia bacterium]
MENRSLAATFAWNFLAVALFFAIFAVMARVGAAFDVPSLIDTFEVAGSLIALWIAFRFRAQYAAVLIAGIDLFLVVEFAFHLLFGYRAVQSGPTHLAIMAAAVLGVVLGALSFTRFAALRSRTS